MIVDTFMFNNELDMLECRLVEIGDAVDWMVAVEADVDHQDHPKPYLLTEHLSRFDQWKDKLVVVRATGLPTVQDDPDPWAREHAQREHTWVAIKALDLPDDTVVLHGDIDEIPTAVATRNVRPRGFVAFEQRGHFFAVDWLYPDPWCGTVAGRLADIRSFGAMRDTRNITPTRLPNAGWHLSWLGGKEANLEKLGSFCHPEVSDRIHDGLQGNNRFLHHGVHVDGKVMAPVDVDKTWPKWVAERRCPENWFRPR